MYRKILEMFNLLREEIKLKRTIDLRVKKFKIRNAVIKWYMDYDKMHNLVNVPAHLRAKEVMKQTLKTPEDIDRCYQQLLDYQRAI